MIMSTWNSIQKTVVSLIDDRQDYWQWFAMIACLIAAIIISRLLRKTLFHPTAPCHRFCIRFFNPGQHISGTAVVFCALLWITWAVRLHWSQSLVNNGFSPIACGQIHTLALLVAAFVVYQLANAISKGKLVPHLLSGGFLFLFTFHLFGWLDPLSQALADISLPLGEIHINLWGLISGLSSLFLLLWLVSLTNRFVDTAVKANHTIPPSIKVLISKTTRIVLFVFALLVALSIAGLPLKGLTIFSGALGLGIGFGLQKIIANLISGLVILLDKSIKPGDVIEIDGSFGWINAIHTRYVSVLTRDRKEYLIPNEDFVTNKVINWSHSDRNIRIKADIAVSYDTDVTEAIRLCTEAVKPIERIMEDPPPACLLKEFGDSSINLQIRFWINDAPNGVSNVKSQVLLAIWQTFRDNNIQIPFPQRDLHIKSTQFPAAPAAQSPLSD